jgi:hypothetical protein
MPPTMRHIHSSHVKQVGHDSDTGDLHVVWDSGRTSVFENVPADLADRVGKSHSVGKALTDEVKGKFTHRYLR